MKKYVLKLELEDTNIWRRVSFTSGIGFYDLHSIIQIIFGWEDYHLYEFTVGNMAIGMLGDDEDIDNMPENFRFEDDASLDLILLNYKEFQYEYDFGDGWEIKITVEEITDTETGENPTVIDFGGDMAKEDCGGAYELMRKRRRKTRVEELNLILEETFDIVLTVI